jgi:hypothetical protein
MTARGCGDGWKSGVVYRFDLMNKFIEKMAQKVNYWICRDEG